MDSEMKNTIGTRIALRGRQSVNQFSTEDILKPILKEFLP